MSRREGVLLLLVALALGVGLAAGGGGARGQEQARRSALERVIARGREFVVRLEVRGGRPLGDAARERLFRDVEMRDAGAGIVVGAREVLTHAALCAYEGASFSLTTADGKRFAARLRRRDPRRGLALLESEAPLGVRPAVLGGGPEPAVGSLVVALGDPFGTARDAQAAASLGVLEGRLRLEARGSAFPDPVLVTDAALNPGSEGGPLLDLDGRVLGVLAPLLRDERSGTLVAHAIPAQAGRALLERRVGLGFQAAPGPAGLRVAAVHPEGPAEQAGLRPGDLIVSVDGAPATAATLHAAAAEGRAVRLAVRRGEETLELRLEGGR